MSRGLGDVYKRQHFSSLTTQILGSFLDFPGGCSFLSFLLVKLIVWTGSLEPGAQPFKNELLARPGNVLLCIWGADEKTLLLFSASVVIMFLLGAHPAVLWTASPLHSWPTV